MLTVPQCASRLSISAARVLQLIRSGALAATRYGRMWLVEEQEFERFAALDRPRGVPRVKQIHVGITHKEIYGKLKLNVDMVKWNE